MKRPLKRLPALALALTLAVTLASFNISASAEVGTTARFDCFLIVDEDETIPNISEFPIVLSLKVRN